MRFWDSSAIVPLLIQEPRTERVRELVTIDQEIAVWWATRVECTSAIRRARRADRIDVVEAARAIERLRALQNIWSEILPANEIRKQADRLLRTHGLRASDALQLAAAIAWSGRTEDLEFIGFDGPLNQAAEAEGFRTLVQAPR